MEVFGQGCGWRLPDCSDIKRCDDGASEPKVQRNRLSVRNR